MSAPTIADRIAHRLTWEDLDPDAMRQLITLAQQEDLSGWGLARPPEQAGDVTSQSLKFSDNPARANLVARDNLVVCGLPLIPLVLDCYGSGARFETSIRDGTACARGKELGTLSGPATVLLQAERVLLNFLQRLSGIASLTHTYVAAMGQTRTRLLDTRKTTPGYRVLEKYAVACGGGFNHRIGLFDRVMLKDNHLAAVAATEGTALTKLIKETRRRCPGLVIELEVDHVDQIQPGLDAGVEVFLLDNFPPDKLVQALALIGDAAATEASGGITLNSLERLASIGLDFISTGATVHQSTWKDIGLDWIIPPQ